MKNYRKTFCMCLICALTLIFSACTSNAIEENAPSFGVKSEAIIDALAAEGFVFEEFHLKEFDGNDTKYKETRLEGRILLDDGGTTDDVTDDEAVGLDISCYNSNDVFWIELPGWITKSGTSDKLAEIYGIILKTVEPGISPDFHKNMETFSDTVSEKESDITRMTLEILEVADSGVRIRTRIMSKAALKELLYG